MLAHDPTLHYRSIQQTLAACLPCSRPCADTKVNTTGFWRTASDGSWQWGWMSLRHVVLGAMRDKPVASWGRTGDSHKQTNLEGTREAARLHVGKRSFILRRMKLHIWKWKPWDKEVLSVLRCIYLVFLKTYLFHRQSYRHRETNRERNLPPTCSFPKCLQWRG